MIMKRKPALIGCTALLAMTSLWDVVSFITGNDGATVGEPELV
jgi:hypothetical protein